MIAKIHSRVLSFYLIELFFTSGNNCLSFLFPVALAFPTKMKIILSSAGCLNFVERDEVIFFLVLNQRII